MIKIILKKTQKNISFLLPLILLCLLIGCSNTSSQLQKDFNCPSSSFNNLETVQDYKKVFTVNIPKNWKTNLYYDALQSSIYSADTTKQLTETTIFDFNLVQKPIDFNEKFQLELEHKNLAQQLISTQKKTLTINNKPAFYILVKGKKQNFPYQKLVIYQKLNDQNFIQIKIEIYGEKSVNKRLCKAINLAEKIKTI